jgi:hypothetical protein
MPVGKRRVRKYVLYVNGIFALGSVNDVDIFFEGSYEGINQYPIDRR